MKGPIEHQTILDYAIKNGLVATEDITRMFNEYYERRDWLTSKGKPLKDWKTAYRMYLNILQTSEGGRPVNPRVRNAALEAAIELTAKTPFVMVEVEVGDTAETLTTKMEEEARRSFQAAKEQKESMKPLQETILPDPVPAPTEQTFLFWLYILIGSLLTGAVGWAVWDSSLLSSILSWFR